MIILKLQTFTVPWHTRKRSTGTLPHQITLLTHPNKDRSEMSLKSINFELLMNVYMILLPAPGNCSSSERLLLYNEKYNE